MYNKINNKILGLLHKIYDKSDIFTETSDMDKFSGDESQLEHVLPEAVVFPKTSNQIAETIRLANEYNFPLTPRGGGTALTGGCIASLGGLVISLEKMNRIIDIDKKTKTAIAEPGVINGNFQREAEKLNLFYPVNPASMDSCTLGGNIALSTGGANTVRYGTTRNYILGINAFNGEGKSWSAGGRIVKNSTDQILIHLACGSEGILSIFTELTFRLLNKPSFCSWLVIPFDNIFDIQELSTSLLTQKLNPTMIELLDSTTLNICSQYLKKDIWYKNYDQMMIRFDADDKDELEKVSLKAGELISGKKGVVEVMVADKQSQQEALWEIRSSIHDSIVSLRRSVCEEDIVVPTDRINDLITEVNRISDENNLENAVFGHLGDGNLHINIFDLTEKLSFSDPVVNKIRENIYKKALSLGGKISGEHGIGAMKKEYFNKYTDSGYLEILKILKKAFDPKNILNPGKLINL